MAEPVIVARTATPEGHEIVLTAIRWAKIVEGHPEMVDHLETILQTVSQPDYREPDIAVGRERMFRRGGPERWMRVASTSNRSSPHLRRPTIPP